MPASNSHFPGTSQETFIQSLRQIHECKLPFTGFKSHSGKTRLPCDILSIFVQEDPEDIDPEPESKEQQQQTDTRQEPTLIQFLKSKSPISTSVSCPAEVTEGCQPI